jgi:predicted hotdog family 3-hydroxylacyl-ACP dehydratase
MSATIESLIPHRPPMRWINSYTEGGEKLFHTTACFSENDFCIADGKVLETALVECVAQTVAAGLGSRQQTGGEGHRVAVNAMLVGVTGFKIHTRPPVGKTIHIEVRETRRLGPMVMIASTITCDGVLCATGNLSLYA